MQARSSSKLKRCDLVANSILILIVYILASELAEYLGDEENLLAEPEVALGRESPLAPYHPDAIRPTQIPPPPECDRGRDRRAKQHKCGRAHCSPNESRETCQVDDDDDDDDDHYHQLGYDERALLPLISQLCWQTQTKLCWQPDYGLLQLGHKFYYGNSEGNARRRRSQRWPSLPTLQRVAAIRLIRLDIAPAHTIHEGQEIRLRCSYETRGDKLQSLSWYRNGREFYRFQPFERRQPVLAFAAPGVHVDITRSKSNTVYLTNTTVETSGRYRCEATGTTFQEANMETHIEVLAGKSGCAHSNPAGLVITFAAISTALYLIIHTQQQQQQLYR